MKRTALNIILIGVLLAGACNGHADKGKTMENKGVDSAAYQPGTFGYDLHFLRQHDSVIVLQSDQGAAQVIVSAWYQAKVFTSTAEGPGGLSFGWIHYKAFAGPKDPHMNGYGGENRIWLGPEGGRFSLFFPKDSSLVFANWKTPAAFDTEAWTVIDRQQTEVTLQKDMQLVNYAGTDLQVSVKRKIAILNRAAIDKLLLLSSDTSVKAVGYQTVNTLTNTGAQAWTEATGMPCIWMLDMFNPSPATVIVIPYKDGTGQGTDGAGQGTEGAGQGIEGVGQGTEGAGQGAVGAGKTEGMDKTASPDKMGDAGKTLKTDRTEKVATTDYFGEIPADRIRYDQGTLFFKADGKSRGKLGIHPAKAKPMAGSYDALHRVLTITLFDVDSSGKYLNQEWNTHKPPFSGDAVNAYNDGPLADGSQMGPFYEIESVGPAASLAPGGSQSHRHAVFHFTGAEAGLDRICKQLLGVNLETIKKVF